MHAYRGVPLSIRLSALRRPDDLPAVQRDGVGDLRAVLRPLEAPGQPVLAEAQGGEARRVLRRQAQVGSRASRADASSRGAWVGAAIMVVSPASPATCSVSGRAAS